MNMLYMNMFMFMYMSMDMDMDMDMDMSMYMCMYMCGGKEGAGQRSRQGGQARHLRVSF